ncbi:dermonecrotic toxin domain-containing protein [Pseudomonas syringae]|uniref:dermonecrotic toxin domain-containing protein n=1 Tax=Pseudomonas syringae TaxID=317 RepID=UPI000CF05C76|nr:ADP-ribosylating toxin [Pseudomonas syringae]MCF5207331.1 ADP-ribosylating toxin [Pseudomonas syringae]MCF5213768.1 ADP-ribosylating toxin [Pseudomonas syringae]MCF5217856.1 ADP-ribosylating toxin [Pseudomonas syringae]MCF5264237.1 ADP-ribosylating toxin [Pseudomonas syringae]
MNSLTQEDVMSPPPSQASKTDQQLLRERAQQFVLDYPDLHDLAYIAASKIILQHTHRMFNPEKVYWHRFGSASSSPRTFTGWQHSGKPVQSMTLIELLMKHFSAHDQEASDELSLYGGFYTDGPDHGFFDERNEVPMLPQDVLNDMWTLDFSSLYSRRMERFWNTHSDNFCILAKAQYLVAAGHCLRKGQLSPDDFKQVTRVVIADPLQTPTLKALQEPLPLPPGVSVHTLDIDGIKAHDLLRIVIAGGREVIYWPDAEQPFMAFDSERALYHWLKEQFMGEQAAKAMTGHFLRGEASRTQDGARFARAVSDLLAHDWRADVRLINQSQAPIAGDPFVYLRDVARQAMSADAREILTSNTDLLKQIWIGYLSAFLRAFGGLAPLSWPVALTLVGASLANTGLNIDQAVNGKTPAQRRAGVLGAILNTLYLLFNLPLLMSIRVAPQPLQVTTTDVASISSEALEGGSVLADPLDNMEGNLLLDTLTPSAEEGRLRGVYTLGNGETWIKLAHLPYRVMFNEQQQCWMVVNPDNPFAFIGSKPVRLNAEGKWTLMASPGLQGGSPMDVQIPSGSASAPVGKPYATVGSSFWDRYLQTDIFNKQHFAETALARQKQVMSIWDATPEDVLESDSSPDGNEVYRDPWQGKHRVFKLGDDDYYAANITLYTQDDAQFNRFLRTGESLGRNQVRAIERLADDIHVVGYNNDVELYRGGSGDRGTSGAVFRSGQIKVGDVLVNTDVTSFSENPYVVSAFASSRAGAPASAMLGPVTFDDTSVVFVLPKGRYLRATPVAPFSASPDEAESIFLPGCYFQIDSIEEVSGEFYRIMKVQMQEVDRPIQGRALYDMRTGEPFSREQYALKLGTDAKVLVDRFFPQNPMTDLFSPR